MENQLTTLNQNSLRPYGKDRTKPLADKNRVWCVVLGWKQTFYLTQKELEIYIQAKEKGLSHCVFADIGLSTNYKYFYRNDELYWNKKKEQQELEITQKNEPVSDKVSIEDWEEMKNKFKLGKRTY